MRRPETEYWAMRGKSWWKDYDRVFPVRRKYFISKVLDFKPNSILELGCCGGCNIQYLEEHKNQIDITGVDVSHEAIEYAKQTKPGYRFINSDITQPFDFLDKKVDVVCSMGVLIHVHPNNINDLLLRMLESSKRGLVLFEGQNKAEQCLNGNKYHFQTTYDFVKRIKTLSATPVEIKVKSLVGNIADGGAQPSQLHEIIVKKQE